MDKMEKKGKIEKKVKMENQDMKLSFDDLDSAAGGLVVDRTPMFSGIGVFDVVDDKTGAKVGSFEDQDDVMNAAPSLGQSSDCISGSEWDRRFR